MSGMNETPKGNRTHIAVFGLRNAGKSTPIHLSPFSSCSFFVRCRMRYFPSRSR